MCRSLKMRIRGSNGSLKMRGHRERSTTKWWWRLDSRGHCQVNGQADSGASTWDSRKRVASEAMPGVEFVIHRMTFGRRLELMKNVRDLAARIEYFDAGRDEKNRMKTNL